MVGALLAGGALTAGLVAAQGDHASAHAITPLTTPATAGTSATTTTPKTTTTVALPTPTPPPADPYAAVPVRQIGTIEIPKIGLVHPIFEGVWLTVVDHGPGHWPGTALPGQLGNTVFAGHRVTHTHPFLNVDLLAPGDRVVFDMPGAVYTYAVTSITVVQPDDIGIVDQTRARTFTLFACHPKHSAAERIVVQGRLVGSKRKETSS